MNEKKFDGLGKIYSKYRPAYPQAFIEYLQTTVGISNKTVVADIGSGTGKLTKQLLDIGKKIFAVEPNADMREVAELNLNGFKNYVSVNATAENTTLDDNSVDFITVAQAFHWFERAKFKQECKRILKPNGKVILVWNTRDFTDESVIESDGINRKYCPDFSGFSGGAHGALYNVTSAESEKEFKNFFDREYESMEFKNDQVYSLEGFIGRTLSASYALKENDENYPAYINELTACFKKHAVDGKMIMPNITTSYTGSV